MDTAGEIILNDSNVIGDVKYILGKLVAPDALLRAETVAQETGEPLEAVATRLGLVSEKALAADFAKEADLPLLGSGDFPDEPVSGGEPSGSFLREMRALPIAMNQGRLKLALANPANSFAVEALGFTFGCPVDRVIAPASDIEAAIDRLYGNDTAAEDDIEAAADENDLERLRDLVSDAPVIRAVNRLISDAVDARASDIHIEPTEDRVIVRMRIDGVLQEAPSLPSAMRSVLVSRIKVMADLNIAERRIPQDGRMRIAVRGNDIDLRVATAPSIHGESVVMRILDRSNLALDFATLGFSDSIISRLRELLARPYGIVLVTGPTGSGKTTTLYTALSEMNDTARKVLTIEDPIEYRLSGIVQTQVNAQIGLTFSSALRSFLRQDPDVMMVGEIRDLETAQIAVQAALTGHVILSTLHTNTATGAVSRLLDMTVEPFLLTSTLNGVLAQRLVRRLCSDCRAPYAPSPAQLKTLGLNTDSEQQFYRAKGCESCNGTGYKGRIALTELLVINDAVSQAILDRADAREIARAAGGSLTTLLEDGISKLRDGDTTFEEVIRVAAESGA